MAAGYVSSDYPRCERILQEVIFKFKLPPKPVPKIDLQEWKDMRKVMYELQRQSTEIKRTQQDISSLKSNCQSYEDYLKAKSENLWRGKLNC